MSDYKPITGELRAKMQRWGWVAEDGGVTFGNCAPPSIDAEPVLAIYGNSFDRLCDAIDAIHANLEAENAALKASAAHAYTAGYEYAEQDRDGWIELPKDADGEYIQPSDIPHLTKANDGKRLAFCPSLELRQDGTWRLAGWTPDRYRILKPTVEDVLREFGDWYAHTKGGCDEDGIITEYASKLRLAGDAE